MGLAWWVGGAWAGDDPLTDACMGARGYSDEVDARVDACTRLIERGATEEDVNHGLYFRANARLETTLDEEAADPPDAVFDDLDRVLELAPEYNSARSARIHLRFDQGRWQEALDDLEYYERHGHPWWEMQARCQLELGDEQRAIELYTSHIQELSEWPSYAGWDFEDPGLPASQCTPLGSQLRSAYLWRGVSLARLGRDQEAVEDFASGLEFSDVRPEGWEVPCQGAHDDDLDVDHLVRFQWSWPSQAEVIAICDRVIRSLRDSDLLALALRARARFRTSIDLDKALHDYERALELRPEWEVARAERGHLRGAHLDDARGALEDFERLGELTGGRYRLERAW